MKFLLGDFERQNRQGDIFEPRSGNADLQEINNKNGVKVETFSTSKTLIVESSVFLDLNMYLGIFSWRTAFKCI
jgi:hypothetical protein